MICKNNMLFLVVNKYRKKAGKPPLSRRTFCKLAAASSAALSMPLFMGCEESSESSEGAQEADNSKGSTSGDGSTIVDDYSDLGPEYEAYDYEEDEEMDVTPQDREYHSCVLGNDTRIEIDESNFDPDVELDDFSAIKFPGVCQPDAYLEGIAAGKAGFAHFRVAECERGITQPESKGIEGIVRHIKVV
jgi:hypothetical protein